MAEYALTNKINLAHERIDAIEKILPSLGGDVRDLASVRDELQKLRGEIQALKMRMGKSK